MANGRHLDFDSEFYTGWYSDAAELSPEEALAHYEQLGRADGRYQNFLEMVDSEFEGGVVPANFDWEFYIENNPEVPDTFDRWQATLHYIQEGRDLALTFQRPVAVSPADESLKLDTDWYSSTYGVAKSEVRSHYKSFGELNLLSPTASFDVLKYLDNASDVAMSGIPPFEHYVRNGLSEGRGAHPVDDIFESSREIYRPAAIETARTFFEFDADFYRKSRKDLANVGWPDTRLKDHYLHFGETEGSRPSAYFDPHYYRERYKEFLSGWRHSALDHFLRVGLLRGFAPSAEVAEGMKVQSLRSAIAWVGFWKQIPGMKAVGEGGRLPAVQSLPTSHVSPKGKATKKRLNWVIPPFSKGGGGHTTIFRAARTFTRLGWESVFWVTGNLGPTQLDKLVEEYIGYFPQSPVTFRSVRNGFSDVENEILIATAWQTAYVVQKNRLSNARLYFVQDRESLFEAAGADAMRADYTYRMGFDFICAGKWLRDMVEPFGGESTHFELCASPSFSSRDLPLEERKTLAAIYVRGSSPRRATDLMIETANRLAEANLGRVVVFGDDNISSELHPGVDNLGVLTTDEMATLFQETRFGLAASATNYSILPGELAAAGTIVVQPASATIAETTVAHGAIEVPPSAEEIVDFIVKTSSGISQSSFDELRRPYMTFAQSISWEKEFESVASWIDETCLADEWESTQPTRTIGVVIPTYYPTEKFIEIAERVNSQLTSFEVTLQIVDSRKDGRISPAIEEVERRNLAVVTSIDAAHFSHGPSRTFGARLLDSDYYAFLTDDSTPADEYWLESLVTPLVMVPNCAYAFGRHKAYDDHPVAYASELKDHFDGLEEQGFVVSRQKYGERYDFDGYLRAALAYNSDNSAAYPGQLLREFGFPNVDFAEDQAWAKVMLDRGYSRAFANTSLIYHSHNYMGDPEEAYKRGYEEAKALFVNFGLIRYANLREVSNAKQATEEIWQKKAAEVGFNEGELGLLLESKHASIDGAWKACREIQEAKSGDV